MAIADTITAQITTAMEINGGDGGGDKEPSPLESEIERGYNIHVILIQVIGGQYAAA